MSSLSSIARVVHILLLGLWLGSGLSLSLVVIPDAFVMLPSRQVAGELVANVINHLDLFLVFSAPVIFLSLLFGYFSLGVRLRGRVLATLVMTGLVVVRSQVLQPKMRKINQAMGRAIDDLVQNDPMKIQYLNLDLAVQYLYWAHLVLALYLLFQAVVTSTPKRKFGIEF